jgi:DNA polymerase I-like protein with 3'-5' exonuclease and polymerase domains/uracil-DNA glycosylase
MAGRSPFRCDAGDYVPGKENILVVLDKPSASEEACGIPFSSQKGKFIKKLVKSMWEGGVLFDYAVRCPGKPDDKNAAVASCRSHLTSVIEEAKPSKILAFGRFAVKAITGESFKAEDIEGGHCVLSDGTTVYYFADPSTAVINRFVRKRMSELLHTALTTTPPEDAKVGDYCVVETVEDTKTCLDILRKEDYIVWDCETSGVMFCEDFELVSVSITSASGETYVWYHEALYKPQIKDQMRSFFGSKIKKIGHNAKYDMAAMRLYMASPVRGFYADTMIMRKMMDGDLSAALDTVGEIIGMGGHKGEAKKAVEDAAKRTLAIGRKLRKIPDEELEDAVAVYEKDKYDRYAIKALKKTHVNKKAFIYGMVPEDVILRYNARDTVTTKEAFTVLRKNFDKKPHLHTIHNKVVRAATPAIEQIEAWGMPFSLKRNDDLVLSLQQEEKKLMSKLQGMGFSGNPYSTLDVRGHLFKKLGLVPIKYTAKGLESTDVETLKRLRGSDPSVGILIDLRKVSKYKGTYAEGLRPHVRDDGRIHPTIQIVGARSGRLACRDPNLQNIPSAKSEIGKKVKDMFEAEPGKLLVEIDYSQLELRIAAMLSRDPLMKEIFVSGQDYHRRTAELISQTAWGIDSSLVTDEHRGKAKAVNFGVLYGMTAGTLAKNINCEKSEAYKIMRAIFGNFEKLDAWCKDSYAKALREGVTYTWWDGQRARERSLAEIAHPEGFNDGARITAKNNAVNTPIQGTGSEYNLASMIEMVRWIIMEKFPAKLVIAVHDSMVFEVEEDCVDELIFKAKSVMLGWPSANGFEVPLKVDAEVGKSWGSLESYGE